MDIKAKQLITKHGGPTKVATLLGYGKKGVYRVSNWRLRGIPAEAKYQLLKIGIDPENP